ncbi:4Fe-4S binding protein [Candidatus Bathyarchaeota archaeon]|nr:4Fe-4S binding protein [Candidatus Bathyarchaeota archaeon]
MIWEIIGDALRISALAAFGIAGVLTVLIWKENLRTRVTYIRLIVQAVAFAAIFYLFSKPIPLFYYLLLFPATIFFGRLYCGWLCPFGFLMDAISQLKRIFRKTYRILPDRLNKSLHKLRYLLLLFFLLLPILLWIMDPPANPNFAFLMLQFLIGPFQPYTFLIDPMMPLVVPWTSPFSLNSIYFNYPYAQNIVTYVSGDFGLAVVVVFVSLTLISSLLFRRAWCRFCPTGSSLAILNRFKGFKWAPLLYIEKNEEKCKDCEVYKIACPMQVSELYEQKNGKIASSQCILCARCVESCPHPDAIKLKIARKPLFNSRNSAGRIPKWVRKLILRSK